MDGIRQALITSLFPPGSSEKLIIHVKTYKDIQSSETSKDIKGTPRYLCLSRKSGFNTCVTYSLCFRKKEYNTTIKSKKKPERGI